MVAATGYTNQQQYLGLLPVQIMGAVRTAAYRETGSEFVAVFDKGQLKEFGQDNKGLLLSPADCCPVTVSLEFQAPSAFGVVLSTECAPALRFDWQDPAFTERMEAMPPPLKLSLLRGYFARLQDFPAGTVVYTEG